MNGKRMWVVVLFLAAVSIAPALAQPLARYTFDDGTALDVSGNGHDGLLLANDTAAAEIIDDAERGGVLKINARGMQVNGPFDITTAFSLAAWIKIDVPRSGRAFSGGPWLLRTDNQGGTDHLWMEVRYPANGFVDKFNTAADPNSRGQLDGQWHHYVWVLNEAGQIVVYFDGVKAPSRDGKTKAYNFNGINTIFFGVETATFTNGLQGCMDDIVLFNYAITVEDVNDLIAGGPQPIARYTFDDGTAADSSGNGYDGLLLANDTATAEVVVDEERGNVMKINGRGMQADGPFDVRTEFTLAGWLKIDVPRSGRSFSGGPWTLRTDNQGGTDHLWMEVRYPAGSFLDKFNTATEANPQGQLDGQWHHYAFLLNDKGEFALYFDGFRAPARDGKSKVHDFNGIGTIFFGTETATFTNALKGFMDDIVLYNVALDEYAIADLAGYDGAVQPCPARGTVDVNDDPLTLQWNGVQDSVGFAKTGYVLYLDADQTAVKAAAGDDPNVTLLVDAQAVPLPVSGPNVRAGFTLTSALAWDTTYYWRVDTEVLVFDPADPNNGTLMTVPGQVWSFRTVAEKAPVIVPTGPLSAVASLEASGNDGQILSINGVPVADLKLGVSSFAGEPANAGSGPEKGDDFSLATYASADGQIFIETVFAQPITTLFLIERGGNDTGNLILFDAQDNLVGMPMTFSPADFGDTGYTSGGQAVKGIVVVGASPFTKMRILKPSDGTLGVDPICVCGM